MNDIELLLRPLAMWGGSVVQPMALKLALEARGVSTSNAAVMIEAAIKSSVLVPTEHGGLSRIPRTDSDCNRSAAPH